jgi:heme/copper-type cytochrome/quinol oxidase subunit 2
MRKTTLIVDVKVGSKPPRVDDINRKHFSILAYTMTMIMMIVMVILMMTMMMMYSDDDSDNDGHDDDRCDVLLLYP